MGASAHRSKPTVHSRDLDKNYRLRQADNPPSPVSPLDSNGENWKFPPVKTTHQKAQATLSEIPLREVSSKKRLSRPFEQPYPMSDSKPRHTPAQTPKRKAVPPALAIPTPAHQPRRQREQNPHQENQAFSERSSTRHHHQGWDPLKEPRQDRSADAPHHKNKGRAAHGHGDGDLERQGKPKLDSQERGALISVIGVVIMAIVVGVTLFFIIKHPQHL